MHVSAVQTRLPLFVLLVLAACPFCAACTHDYAIENRETPVHVWLTAPELAERGGSIDALIYVGAEKAIEGPVRFPCGVVHVALPTLYMPAGEQMVSAVFQGGAISATEEVDVDGETWIQVVVRGRTVRITGAEEEPRQNLGGTAPPPTTRIPSPQGR